MDKKDIAYQIGIFIEKASIKKELGTPTMKLPKCKLQITGIYQIKVDEESLVKFSNLWTFKAQANVNLFDSTSKVTLNRTSEIIGNVIIEPVINQMDSTIQPTILSVEITNIKYSSKQ